MGRFKYIDKWRSKTGKWVYKYKEDVGDRAQKGLQYVQRSSEKILKRGPASAPKPHAIAKRTNRQSQWHSIKNDPLISGEHKRRAIGDNPNIPKNDQTRVRNGRREYRNSAEFRNMKTRTAQINAEVKAAYANRYGPLKKGYYVLANLNDKYGPKHTYELGYVDRETGERFVDKYRYNIIGGRTVSIDDSYSYYLDENNIDAFGNKKPRNVKKVGAGANRPGAKLRNTHKKPGSDPGRRKKVMEAIRKWHQRKK